MPLLDRFLTLRDDVSQTWSPTRFGLERLPVSVGYTPRESVSWPLVPCCLDMLIKLPGGDVKLPELYRGHPALSAFLQSSLDFEDALLPGWRESHYAYLTVDCRRVRAGRTHRNAGWHFDGMQGQRHQKKLLACHQYVASSRLPTEFAYGPFDASELDEVKHNWFEELGRQADLSTRRYNPEPHEIVVMSAYQLHRSVPAAPKDEGLRTFIRLDISQKQQDRLGNTVNPILAAPWPFVERSLPVGLETPISDAGWLSEKKAFMAP